ncbi:type III secretion system export apparatus subunit SctV [Burkholderia glumae]|uniref:type III secretion system export apparatus subunit SctV n=1 Tax=Burkholderia glumae TaxID=337 RepID=UPI0013744268|nr:type III secretion system export apparatus subunit SctV [Burkholderia glumae]MCR1769226.1 type III secretion system export apparatus subunit SctV [Burkholderia glumae]QHP93664.1 EscV/YscV/HrcV family type III secretion system export apparatus protein [Burkholderia glumae]QJP69927.1 type III secretion system export apparatus subunit SctV [Burkholderia glumae]QKM51362.1 Secretion system apparatus protein SsaV [Burkholderia glumae]
MLKSLKLPAGGEIGIVALVVAIISLMILPLPPLLIDMLLGLNITISVTLLMITMYVPDISALSAFPSLLLFTTLFRLSLNIASTKSILLHAEAGNIIESFGKLVVGGNLVVGLVVFAIITTVQFIVIAKGSERVAEVGARFTLDALPGKQMSIDADLRANLLTPEEAKRKRATLAVESQLHGGMDGAMKFVKGDAIAGLIITMINILAGIAVGVAYHGMSAGDAANRFSVLSVGDAMVSQIPSLLLSVAAGVMITRVADERQAKQRSLGDEIGHQLGSSSRALFFAAVLLLGFAIVPGFPSLLFVLLAAALSFAGYRLSVRKPSSRDSEHGGAETLASMQRVGAKTEVPPILPRAPQFACAVGVRISPDLAAKLAMPTLDAAFEAERAALQEALGLPFPGITMWVHAPLPVATFEILIHDVPHLMVTMPTGKAMLPDLRLLPAEVAAASAEKLQALAEKAEDGPPVDSAGTPTRWIDERAVPAKTPVWRTEQIIAHACVAAMRRHATLFLGIQEVQWILDQLSHDAPGLVAEVQKVLPPQRIADVLRRLLEEQVSIRNVRSIMESLIAWGAKEKDMLMLTEYVRGDLSRFLAHRAAKGERQLSAVLFDMQAEQHIRAAIKQTPTGNFLALPPNDAAFLIDRIQSFVGAAPREGVVLVTSMDIRRYVRRMIESRLGWLSVYSYQELGEHVELKPVGRVTLSA